MDDVKPGIILSAGIPGGLALVAASRITDSHWEWVRACLMVIGIVLACFAVTILTMWVWENATLIRSRFLDSKKRSEAITPELLLTQAKKELTVEISKLNTEGLSILAHRSGILTPEFDLFENEPKVGGVEWYFWCDFLSHTEHDQGRYFLCPIGRWSSGSKEQIKARRITDYLVSNKLALERREQTQWTGGNRSAEWLSREVYEKVYLYFWEKLPPPPLGEDASEDME